MLIAEAERRGVWLVRGGMQRVADALARAIEGAGNEIRYECHVERIETRQGRATGVVLSNGENIASDAVVFNGDTQALAEGLLGQDAQTAARPRKDDGFTLSAITTSAVGRARGFPLAYHTVLFGDDYPEEFEAVFARGEICPRPTVYICAQDRAGHRAPDSENERLFCLINAPPKALQPDRVEDAIQTMHAHLERHGLELDIDSSSRVVTGPGEFGQRFPASRGSLYGRPTHGPWGSFSRPGAGNAVTGLFLAGGSVHPGAGIPMAAQSGRLAAREAAGMLGLNPGKVSD
jgi:1-hydroxycarotenoid 3,4-desaturase